jgi:hypothetical protein
MNGVLINVVAESIYLHIPAAVIATGVPGMMTGEQNENHAEACEQTLRWLRPALLAKQANLQANTS